jgi:anti-sigma B factor antagonist
VGPVTLLQLSGEIDGEGVNALRVALLNCLKEKRCKVVMNLKDVQYISFMGLGVLVERLRQLRLLGGDLKLVGPNVFAQRVFRLAGVTSIFDTYDTDAHAAETFREAA